MRVLGLLGKRHGDNEQVRALARSVGSEIRFVELRHTLLCQMPNSFLGASLVSLAKDAREAIESNFDVPELVIASGRRSVPAVRWLKGKANGSTRLVHIGRPRMGLDEFDLVLTTAQYCIPDAPNVFNLVLPFVPDRGEAIARRHVFVIAGGPSFTARMAEGTIDRLAAEGKAIARRVDLPIMAATSPRTPAVLAERYIGCLAPMPYFTIGGKLFRKMRHIAADLRVPRTS